MNEFSIDTMNFQAIYRHYMSLIREEIGAYESGMQVLVFPIIPAQILRSLCRNVNYHFQREPVLLRIDLDTIVVGDLHGHILDLFRILKKFGTPPVTKYLFLGDIVDRGEFSIETITFIFLMKALFPQSVYIIRGNHEFPEMYHSTGFYAELMDIYNRDQNLDKEFQTTFSNMPIAALLFNKVLCLHGGIGPSVTSIQNISSVMRPIMDYNREPICSIVWSDPSPDKQGFSPSTRGSGYFFGKDVLLNFLHQNNIEIVVRGHQCIDSGISVEFNKRLITVFSASYYCGSLPNKAGVLAVMSNGNKKEATIFQPIKYVLRKRANFVRSEKENIFSISKEDLEKASAKKLLPTLSSYIYKGATTPSIFTQPKKQHTAMIRKKSEPLGEEVDSKPRKITRTLGKRAQSECILRVQPTSDNQRIIKREKSLRKIDNRRYSVQ